jgi:phosphoribosylformimino-5-aminoimidazole carboxamide ribotide isomerase
MLKRGEVSDVPVIPAVDLLGGRVVRLCRGRYDRVTAFSDDPLAVARRLADLGGGWLHVIDLDAARSGERPPAHARVIRDLAGLPGMRLQVGGGVRSAADIEDLWGMGVERVLVGSLAASDPGLVGELARAGGGRLAAAADSRDGRIRTHGWEHDSGVEAAVFVERLAKAGVDDFLVTGIDRDGTGAGPDTALLRLLRPLVPGLLLAAGGVAGADHVAAAGAAGADAVVVGRALLEGVLGVPAGSRHPKE